MKQQESTRLPRFVAGAIATAGASAANGATVQISFANNVLSTVGENNSFNADVTGDGSSDILIYSRGLTYVAVFGKLGVVSGRAFADQDEIGDDRNISVMVGSILAFDSRNGGPVAAHGLLPISFSDGRVNYGARTHGWLDVEALSIRNVEQRVQILRLIFDDASTTAPAVGALVTYPTWQVPAVTEPVSAVPEPGSNLALLALGAGGMTLRRRLMRPDAES